MISKKKWLELPLNNLRFMVPEQNSRTVLRKLHTKMLSKTSKYLSMITVENIDQNALLVRAGSSGGIYTIKGDAFMTKDLVLSWKAPEDIDNIRINNYF